MRGNLVACNPWKRASLAERWSLFKRVIKELPPQVHDGRYRKDWNVSRKLRRGTSGWTLKIWVIVSGFKQSKHCVFVSLAAIWIPPPHPPSSGSSARSHFVRSILPRWRTRPEPHRTRTAPPRTWWRSRSRSSGSISSSLNAGRPHPPSCSQKETARKGITEHCSKTEYSHDKTESNSVQKNDFFFVSLLSFLALML